LTVDLKSAKHTPNQSGVDVRFGSENWSTRLKSRPCRGGRGGPAGDQAFSKAPLATTIEVSTDVDVHQ